MKPHMSLRGSIKHWHFLILAKESIISICQAKEELDMLLGSGSFVSLKGVESTFGLHKTGDKGPSTQSCFHYQLYLKEPELEDDKSPAPLPALEDHNYRNKSQAIKHCSTQ
jgi:hypothetical protein